MGALGGLFYDVLELLISSDLALPSESPWTLPVFHSPKTEAKLLVFANLCFPPLQMSHLGSDSGRALPLTPRH